MPVLCQTYEIFGYSPRTSGPGLRVPLEDLLQRDTEDLGDTEP